MGREGKDTVRNNHCKTCAIFEMREVQCNSQLPSTCARIRAKQTPSGRTIEQNGTRVCKATVFCCALGIPIRWWWLSNRTLFPSPHAPVMSYEREKGRGFHVIALLRCHRIEKKISPFGTLSYWDLKFFRKYIFEKKMLKNFIMEI